MTSNNARSTVNSTVDGMSSQRGFSAVSMPRRQFAALAGLALASACGLADIHATQGRAFAREFGGAGGSGGGMGNMGAGGGLVDKSDDEQLQALIDEVADSFEQVEWTDDETGLSVTCNLFLPDGYDGAAAGSAAGSAVSSATDSTTAGATSTYPMVVFIADSSVVGSDATASLTQGYGALVFASQAWQAEHPCIVLVPTYPETVLDDHNGYTTTDYVELTARLVRSFAQNYAVDATRIYGTGQSMGCMITLILDAEYPDLYAACMFVDGQWDITTLDGLEDRTFVYFAAEGDDKAWTGLQEVEAMFDTDEVDYSYAQWDATWSEDEIASAADSLFEQGTAANFISWAAGTVLPEGVAQGTSEHMYSFDYAYKSTPVLKWLFEQQLDA